MQPFLIGYNRRFYQATLALEEKLKEEELVAANFEITEWSHRIENGSFVELLNKSGCSQILHMSLI